MNVRDVLREPDLTLSMALLLGFVVLCALQVVVRFVLAVPLSWTEELASALVIWMTFVGIIAVERRDSHIRVELLDEVLSKKTLAVLYGLFDILVLMCCAGVMWAGALMLSEPGFQRTPALAIPIKVLVAVVPVAVLAMTVYRVRNSLRRFRDAWS